MTFAQIMDFASQDIFKVCVKRYNGNHKTKEFSCWKQFLCLAFGQLTHRESMSDTMLCLKLNADKLYHLGIGKVVNKSTLSRANEKRDWHIFQDFGLKLIEQARILYEVNAMDYISVEKGSYYIMDKAYIDFARLYNIKQDKAYFVVRAKDNFKFKRRSSRSVDKSLGIICDQEIILTGVLSSGKYPEPLRRIRFYDVEFERTFVFLTNNFKLKAITVTQLYKHRWKIELFFKWIKQNLKVQSFWGFTENAVKTQIWTAISVYVLVAIAKKKLNLEHSPYEILQYISLAPFEKTPLAEVFLNNKSQDVKEQTCIQLKIL